MQGRDPAEDISTLPDATRRALLDFFEASAGGKQRSGELEADYVEILVHLRALKSASGT